MMTDNLRPGCFGSVVSFDPLGRECVGCPHNDACSEATEANVPAFLDHLERLDVSLQSSFKRRFLTSGVVLKRHRTHKQNALNAELASLKSAGVSVESIAPGDNPFVGKVPYLDVALRVVRIKQRTTRAELARFMLAKFKDWEEDKALKTAGLAVAVLQKLGLVADQEGFIHAVN